jgi:hypothetical protein
MGCHIVWGRWLGNFHDLSEFWEVLSGLSLTSPAMTYLASLISYVHIRTPPYTP